jgi:AmmeMemoRadiSam system protein B
VLDKKLPMPSNNAFETPLGSVPVNDYMRNEFCDEDDDFFIHDEAFSKDMMLFHQLMMLQGQLDEFSALSVQIADESHFIVKELAHVLEEVLASRNALIVFCCDLDSDWTEEFSRVKQMVEDESYSNLLNYLNSGESHMSGTAAFIAGIIVAKEWGLQLNFSDEDGRNSLLTAYADRERVMY